MAQELKVIQDFCDFMLWTTRHVEKFPRNHRHSLGVILESGVHTILALLLRAKYSRDKAEYLREVNIELEILRFRIRMAKDLKILPVKSHGHAAKLINEIGMQVGGWLASKAGAK